MDSNMSRYAFLRQVGMPHKKKSNGSIPNKKDFMRSFTQHHIQDIFSLSRQMYVVPGEVEDEVPPYAVQFCTAPGYENLFGAADETGIVSFFKVREAATEYISLRPFHEIRPHMNAVFDIAWVPYEHLLATASGDQTAALWDMIEQKKVNCFRGHSCSLKSVDVSKHNTNLLATGSRDGNALIWDRRVGSQEVLRIQDAHVIHDSLTPVRKRRRGPTSLSRQRTVDSCQTVSCVIFQDSNTVITSGAMDVTLKIWDLRKIQKKKTSAKSLRKDAALEYIPYPGSSQRRRGYTCLTLDSSSTNLYASCTDDSIYHYNLSTSSLSGEKRKPVCTYKGQYNTSFYIKTALSPDDEFLLSGSDDKNAYIWKANGEDSNPVVRFAAEDMQEVTAVAWCSNDITKLVTCSDECVVRQWNIPYNGTDHVKSWDIIGKRQYPKTENGIESVMFCVRRDPVPATEVATPNPVLQREADSNDIVPFEESQITVVQNNPESSGKVFQRETVVSNEGDNSGVLCTPLSINLPAKPTPSLMITPQKANPNISPPNSSTKKLSTPLRNLNNNLTLKTPTSIEKWIVRTPTQKNTKACDGGNFPRNRVVKCLEDHMTEVKSNEKENTRTPKKNWWLELSKRSRSKDNDASPARKKQKPMPSSPNSSSFVNGVQTPVKMKSLRTLDSYFTSPKPEK